MEVIRKYFPELSPKQLDQLEALGELYAHWNARVNLISRKDIDHLYERHVLHSMSIARVLSFRPGTELMDVGTGGGFPGIPLAILFPESGFCLVDSIGKKIRVAGEIAREIGLQNTRFRNERAERVQEKFDFVISRAVTRLPEFCGWASGKFRSDSFNALPNGVLYLKGGDLAGEIGELDRPVRLFKISDFFGEAFFETKYVVHVAM